MAPFVTLVVTSQMEVFNWMLLAETSRTSFDGFKNLPDQPCVQMSGVYVRNMYIHYSTRTYAGHFTFRMEALRQNRRTNDGGMFRRMSTKRR